MGKGREREGHDRNRRSLHLNPESVGSNIRSKLIDVNMMFRNLIVDWKSIFELGFILLDIRVF